MIGLIPKFKKNNGKHDYKKMEKTKRDEILLGLKSKRLKEYYKNEIDGLKDKKL